jgi:hypothetical protein
MIQEEAQILAKVILRGNTLFSSFLPLEINSVYHFWFFLPFTQRKKEVSYWLGKARKNELQNSAQFLHSSILE